MNKFELIASFINSATGDDRLVLAAADTAANMIAAIRSHCAPVFHSEYVEAMKDLCDPEGELTPVEQYVAANCVHSAYGAGQQFNLLSTEHKQLLLRQIAGGAKKLLVHLL